MLRRQRTSMDVARNTQRRLMTMPAHDACRPANAPTFEVVPAIDLKTTRRPPDEHSIRHQDSASDLPISSLVCRWRRLTPNLRQRRIDRSHRAPARPANISQELHASMPCDGLGRHSSTPAPVQPACKALLDRGCHMRQANRGHGCQAAASITERGSSVRLSPRSSIQRASPSRRDS